MSSSSGLARPRPGLATREAAFLLILAAGAWAATVALARGIDPMDRVGEIVWPADGSAGCRVVLAATGPSRDIQEQPIARFGIDGHVETFSGNTPAGRLVAVQITSGSGASRG